MRENVAIFWDYEVRLSWSSSPRPMPNQLVQNVAPPSGLSGYTVAEKIRSTVRTLGGVITTFKAYLALSAPVTSTRTILLRSELQSSGVSVSSEQPTPGEWS